MNFIITILVITNFIWICYLTYIVYKKNSTKSKGSNTINTSNTKIGLVRFNPFDDIGGDQSFILSLLDNTNSGVIITSLHNRSTTRVYAKPVLNGEGDNVTLSKEEKTAILKTIKG